MKRPATSIARRLFLYFSASTLLFILCTSGIFGWLFTSYMKEYHWEQLESNALSIAEKLNNKALGVFEYQEYLKIASEYISGEVWIIDSRLNLIVSPTENLSALQFEELPQATKDNVNTVFEGKIVYTQNFSSLLHVESFSVGVPIVQQGKVSGVVLLHEPMSGYQNTIQTVFQALGIALVVALGLSFLLAQFLSLKFTKPLIQMQKVTNQLRQGTYTVKTQVARGDEIGELATNIDELAVALQQVSIERANLDATRNAFFANISHELKTPLTIMESNLEAIQDGMIPEVELEDTMQMIRKESAYMRRLVFDLLDLAKLDNTDFSIAKQPLDFHAVLEDALYSAKKLGIQKQITWNVTIQPLASSMLGDYDRLRQLLMIILDNAIKFSHPQGVIDIILEPTKLRIRDYGVGMSDEMVEQAIKRYVKTSRNNADGSGLGLNIAQAIAHRHDMELHLIKQSPGVEVELRWDQQDK
ncbi:MAG: ATP-binding protein [Erysipelotrichaceae bacterium]